MGWGSTLGAIEEAVDRLRADGLKVSSVHLRFLSPLEPGLKEIFSKFRKVLAVEINYSDDLGQPYVDEGSRRYSQLARLLRAQTLMEIDCWSRVPGGPIAPGVIENVLRSRVEMISRK